LTGKPAPIESLTVTVVDPGLENLSTSAVDADGKGFTLTSNDNPGDTTFLVDADAKIGEGIENVQDTVTLSVIGANAANLGLVADAPEAK
jgi:hypothetical protein